MQKTSFRRGNDNHVNGFNVLYGLLLSQAPGLSIYALQSLLALHRVVLSLDIFVAKTVDLFVDVAAAERDRKCLMDYAKQSAAHCRVVVSEVIVKVEAIRFGCAKGTVMVSITWAKGVALYCCHECRVKHYCIDVNASGGRKKRLLWLLNVPWRPLLVVIPCLSPTK